jgi:hypothetical protein
MRINLFRPFEGPIKRTHPVHMPGINLMTGHKQTFPHQTENPLTKHLQRQDPAKSLEVCVAQLAQVMGVEVWTRREKDPLGDQENFP